MEFMLCSLEHGRVYQQALDLNFTEGEQVTFCTRGKGKGDNCESHGRVYQQALNFTEGEQVTFFTWGKCKGDNWESQSDSERSASSMRGNTKKLELTRKISEKNVNLQNSAFRWNLMHVYNKHSFILLEKAEHVLYKCCVYSRDDTGSL